MIRTWLSPARSALRACAAVALSAVALSAVAGCGDATGGTASKDVSAPKATRDPEVLNVALLPDEAPSKILQDNAALKAYLEKETGKKVELHVLTSYSAMIEAMRAGRLDLGYFGPLSYCLARQKAPIEPFAVKLKDGVTTYQAILIANVNAGIADPEDVRGKKVAYGDPASTSSHLIPKSMLAQAGVKEGDYEEHFLGKHDAVALNVQRGNADAGGLSKPIFEGLVAKGSIDAAKVKVVAESKPSPDYPWAMQSDLDPKLKEKIRKAFYSLKDPAILKPLKADGFAPTTDEDYDVVRELAKILGKDLESLAQ